MVTPQRIARGFFASSGREGKGGDELPSTVTTPVAMRVTREDADALHKIAGELGVSTSTVAAGLVRYALSDERRGQVLEAVALLKQAQGHPALAREWRRLVLRALECLDDGEGS